MAAAEGWDAVSAANRARAEARFSHQAALIAGRIANPRDYGPRANMTLALARRAYVLGQMHEKGFLSDAQWEAASQETVALAPAVEASSELAPEAGDPHRFLPKAVNAEAVTNARDFLDTFAL